MIKKFFLIFFIFCFINFSYSSTVLLSDATITGLNLDVSQKAGLLDTLWANNGSKVFDLGGTDSARAVRAASDGSVFVAGKTDSSGFLTKFNRLGATISSFGSSGVVTNSTVTGGFVSLVFDESTYRIYALGTDSTDCFVVAYDGTTGSLVTTFGTNGTATLSGQTQATGLGFDATGLYVLTGGSSKGTLNKLSLTTGSLDSQFNSGSAMDLTSSFELPLGIKVKNGFVYVVGTISSAPYTSIVQKRNSATGASVWSNSYAENPLPSSTAYGYDAIDVDSNGVVYFPIDDGTHSGLCAFAASDGTPTNSIPVGTYSLLNSFIIFSLLVDSRDGILLFGNSTGGFGPAKIVRISAGGAAIDGTFGSGGSLTNTDIDRTNQRVKGAFDKQGKILFVGETSGGDAVVARYTGSGSTGFLKDKIKENQFLGVAQAMVGRPNN